MAEAGNKNTLATLTKNSDILLAVGVIGMLVFMVIPLPKWTLDLLLSFNITFSVTVLIVSLYLVNPLDFAVFPGLLLIMTLFRLSLNVASTRLILGQADAGDVIQAFGSYVVRGNYVVGFIIFIILVLINFLVIVKGSGRIAEVAARFTLDAMPGKQMAIDADLNAGILSDDEARSRRQEISKEAEFHGAMDGAAKFVKGDAIAGLIITGVNILAGFFIGLVQLDMSATEAIQTYSMLTIGDGLVSQIPALIVSTSAGIVVSRAAAEANLGSDLTKQLLAEPKPLFIASGTLMFFGMAPGLPFIPFAVMAGLAGVMGYFSMQSQKEDAQKVVEEEPLMPEPEEKIESYLQVDPLELEIGYGLIPLVDAEQGGDLLGRITTMRKQIAMEMGFIVPPIRIRDNIQLSTNEYVVRNRGNEVSRNEVFPGMMLAMNPGTATSELDGKMTTEPAFGLSAYWIEEDRKEEAELAGYTVVEASAVIATHLMEIIKNNADSILSRQDTKKLIDNMKNDYPAVVDEVIPQLSIGAVQKVLQNLLSEKIPIRDLVTILETLADFIPSTRDVTVLTEYVRQSLKHTITQIFVSEDGMIHTLTLDARNEQMIEDSVRQASQAGSSFSIPPDVHQKLIEEISEKIEEMMSKGYNPLILTSPTVRMHLMSLVEPAIPGIIVLSYGELTSTVQVESEGGISTYDD
ncbi:MAG: flagellar biosynthesis protein FlhA [bacterium]|nr:flagellar biosynthesis protein FlhA [bacterium]